jgi:histone H3/H4
MEESELSTAAVHRLIEKSGAVRIGDDAVNELRRILENLAIKIGKEALELASHAGRKTIRAEDIKLALKRVTIE